jgi:hypothetical protein
MAGLQNWFDLLPSSTSTMLKRQDFTPMIVSNFALSLVVPSGK